jgi:hypothetical protein
MEETKTRYKLDTGLRSTYGEDEFYSDEEAWNELNKIIPNAYGCLYKIVCINVPINNSKEYVKRYNEKYSSFKIDPNLDYRPTNIWMPVLEGITSHLYLKQRLQP